MATEMVKSPGTAAPEALILLETSTRKRARMAVVAVAALVVGLFGGAAVLPIGSAIIGFGEVAVQSNVKQIAHPTGGVIAEILIRDGDHVKKGDVLMRLDTTVSSATAKLTGATLDQLLAQRARLEAEREDLSSVVFPRELVARSDASARDSIASEARLFQIRRRELTGQEAQLLERLRQLEQQIRGYQGQISAINQQSRIIEPERSALRELWEKRLVNISRLNQLEREAVDLRGSASALDARIAETRARISETREQMINLRQSARSNAGTELARVTAQLSEQMMQSVSAGDVYGRSVIRAPHDGIVDKLVHTTIGGVVRPAETILAIVPVNDELTVDARISPADIDQVRKGQKARIRFSAFNVQTTYESSGKVGFVSAERIIDEKSGVSFYRVRVDVDGASSKERKPLKLVPGMPAEIFIETGSRSMLSYLTKPVSDQFSRAFKNN